MLTRGIYATSVNIHNPNNVNTTLYKKLALTFPPGWQRPGKIIPLAVDKLKPDQALGTSCDDIRRRVFSGGFPAPYIEGYVVVQSNHSLDVTGVYTTAGINRSGTMTDNNNIDVERIAQRVKHVQVKLPGLLTIPDVKTGSFCRRKGDQLIVTVKNQGAGSAGASKTEVNFFRFGKFFKSTSALAPNVQTDLQFKIPFGCFNPVCDFRITVDTDKAVNESDEDNNIANDLCLG